MGNLEVGSTRATDENKILIVSLYIGSARIEYNHDKKP